MKTRCTWAEGKFPAYALYHDEEWGVPVFDDRKHFEFLVLEAAQAGLSWATVLRRREGYRRAFADFDPGQVARFDEARIEALCQDASIIRNRAKIRATVHNAHRFLELQQEFGSFSTYLWGFVDGKPIVNTWASSAEVPARTALSDRVSADLQKRGFKFVGSVVIYAHLQACGLVNDHTTDCYRWAQVQH
ncbi:DNA-3-methyladenine glycosylase I [Catalinimonas alkaloidigena]|uniref:DNA-3-methyladenine glycosylase I n=1 Tax=Catalinimonas alkaloidigena TaxID=1075417 RepID=A0A1G9JDP7_9BACT|nr:DNA-3-methyladenine glycosylase I [Catalinimonas alkaloidigena]SDL35757.1 DNA-3-methyladenine glycosylase I [Catalinimonas alkaloidigena]